MEKISFNEFKKVDLRVGKIKSVKEHPKADKLYILNVDLGEGEHDIQLVAGLKGHYKENELIGKKIVVDQFWMDVPIVNMKDILCRANNMLRI